LIAVTTSVEFEDLFRAGSGLDKIASASQLANPIRTEPTSIAKRLPFLI
jgi:hypothetical protein